MKENKSYTCPWCQVPLKADDEEVAEMVYLPTHAATRMDAARKKWCKGSRMPVGFNSKDDK